eukprot:425649-Prorocentrum_minimum.AAC.1
MGVERILAVIGTGGPVKPSHERVSCDSLGSRQLDSSHQKSHVRRMRETPVVSRKKPQSSHVRNAAVVARRGCGKCASS